jgi:hypothetical protein
MTPSGIPMILRSNNPAITGTSNKPSRPVSADAPGLSVILAATRSVHSGDNATAAKPRINKAAKPNNHHHKS